MGREGRRIALICTHSVAAIIRAGRHHATRAFRRTAIITVILLLVGSSHAAVAKPIGYQFSSTLDFGAMAGTPIWGSMSWNDPGPGYSTAPLLSLTLNVGSRQYGLSDGLFPAYVYSPHLDPTFGFANNWGPRFQLRPNLLLGGLRNLGLFEGGNVFIVYSYLPTTPFQYLTQASGTIVAVPEPGSLVLGLSGLALALFARKRAKVGRTRVN